MQFFFPCFYSFVACVAYCMCVNLKGWRMVWASLGGAIGWGVYLLFGFFASRSVSVHDGVCCGFGILGSDGAAQ
jgi:uncharacterized membrane protein YjjB (DUF3815 family)